VKQVGDELGIGFLGLGMWPDKARSDLPVMPKGRYKIMLNYMPKVGSLGLDMMLRTCTIQVNLDYASEADMAAKFRVGLALQPLATALFASSPFTEGRPNGFRSFRSHIWSDTDRDRTGMLPFVFEDGFGYERYLDYALDVPMYFVYRDGRYIDVAGRSFRDFMDGRLPSCPARSRASPTSRIICRPSSPRCGSRTTSRCAAPTAANGPASAPCPLCGSACSTTAMRWAPPGTR
jgi:glutamate--cysteine ligase